MFIWILISSTVIALDQIAKYIVEMNVSPTDIYTIIPHIIDFVYVKNTGAAFSIFSNSTRFLGLISVLFCLAVILYWYLKQPKSKMFCLSLSLLFAGAFGNAIDRVFRGYVVDFIEFSFVKFPVFNIADIAITAGAVVLVIYFLFFDKEVNDGKTDDCGGELGQSEN